MLGHLGKEKMLKAGILSYALRSVRLLPCGTALVFIVAACSTGLPRKFVGDLQPVAGTCDSGNRAVLTRTGSSVFFEPQEGVIVLNGNLSEYGEVAASVEMPGMNHVAYRLTFTGHVDGNRIHGTYVTLHCRYRVILRGTSN
jgi:hypothetical protein